MFLIKVSVNDSVNKDNNLTAKTTDVKLLDSNELLNYNNTDHQGQLEFGDVFDVCNAYYPVRADELSKKYVYILYSKDNAIGNNCNGRYSKPYLYADVICGIHQMIDVMENEDTRIAEDIKETLKFYSDDNGLGELDEDFIPAIENKLDKYGIGYLICDLSNIDENGCIGIVADITERV